MLRGNLTTREQIRAIISRRAAANNTTYDEVMGRSRVKHVCKARFEAMAEVAQTYPHFSLPHIGRIFDRDHNSVTSALMKQGFAPRSKRIREYAKFAAYMQRVAVGTTQTEGENRNENT